jgi:chemotaxis protein MotB
MRRRPGRRAHVNQERWLVSYADFITLLFAFFVVLYSSAQVDKRKIGQLAVAIQAAFQEMGVFSASPSQGHVDTQPKAALRTLGKVDNAKATAVRARKIDSSQTEDLSKLMHELQDTLAPELQRNEVALRSTDDGLIISLREIGFFETGSAEIRGDSLPAFGRIAALLSRHSCGIRIEGHTDNVPIHNSRFTDNWELSTARSTQLVRLLITKYGYAAERLSAAGYAEYHPVASNDSAETRAQNRRVDIVVLGRFGSEVTNPFPSEDGSRFAHGDDVTATQ